MDADTWDDWGGPRDPHEMDPQVTAGRELGEESMGLLPWQPSNSDQMVYDQRKKMVTYLS